MGGIPTNVDGQVTVDEYATPVPGLYAVGECACVSVHGANRLGTNSLNDLLVFGRRAGAHMAIFCREASLQLLPADPAARVKARMDQLRSGKGTVRPAALREHLQRVMMQHVGVFRVEAGMQQAVREIHALRSQVDDIRLDDRGHRFNTDLLEAFQTQNLLDLAEVIAAGALARHESRGAHAREDFPNRDDRNWLVHTLAFRRPDGGTELRYKPVVIARYQPRERLY